MAFMKIAPSPGLFTDGTRYSAEGTWYDSDKVRFRKGFAEKIGAEGSINLYIPSNLKLVQKQRFCDQ